MDTFFGSQVIGTAEEFIDLLSLLEGEQRMGWWAYLLEITEAQFGPDEFDTILVLLRERQKNGRW